MKLPPHTISGPSGTGDYFNGHTDASMLAYGQRIREQALEDAANICIGIATAPSNVVLGVAINCADKIRELKQI